MGLAGVRVRLRNDARSALQGAAAAAKTCYAEGLVRADQTTSKAARRLLPGLWEAGHHTVFQHQHLEFEIEGISRHCVRGFLHTFPFYNTEQQSQRYAKPPGGPGQEDQSFFTPALPAREERIFRESARSSFEACLRITEDLLPAARDQLRATTPPKRLESAARRLAQENARYLLPGCARSNLVYTIPLLSLAALHRTAPSCECPGEAVPLIQSMRDALIAQAPGAAFLFEESRTPMPAMNLAPIPGPTHRSAELTHLEWPDDLPEDLVLRLLDPDHNPDLLDDVDLAPYADWGQILSRIHIAYARRISLSADMQNQRHRLLRAHRPPLKDCVPLEPGGKDIHAPDIFLRDGIHDDYQETAHRAFQARAEIHQAGFPAEAAGLLPNCATVSYVEEGPLPAWMHRWTLRTCLNAQEEIRRAAMDELTELKERSPELAQAIGPPCVLRNGRKKPRCPEGIRFCGIPVWNQWRDIQQAHSSNF